MGSTLECTVTGLPAGSDLDFRVVGWRVGPDGERIHGFLSNSVSTTLDDPTLPEPEPEPQPGSGSLRITPSSGGTLTALGSSIDLQIAAEDGDGNSLPTPDISWTSSDVNVATVNSTGRVISLALGTAVITASAACCSPDSITVLVEQQVASVSIRPAETSLEAGQSIQASAEALDANGNRVPDVSITWSSTDPSVLSVSDNGLVRAIQEGTASVEATVPSGLFGSLVVSVTSVDGGSTPSSPFANRPTTWRTLQNQDFSGSIVPTNNGWFDISGSIWGGRRDSDSSVVIERHGDGPVSAPNQLTLFLPEGLADGQSVGGAHSPVGPARADSTSGFYVAYVFRLSENWTQGETPIHGNTFKHVETSAYGPNGSRLLWRTGITKIPGDPEGRFRMKLNPWGFQANIEFDLTAATAWSAGEWVTIEVLTNFGPHGGIRMWVNGVLAAHASDVNVPFHRNGGVALPNVHGGGIGMVTEDKYLTFDHVYLAEP